MIAEEPSIPAAALVSPASASVPSPSLETVPSPSHSASASAGQPVPADLSSVPTAVAVSPSTTEETLKPEEVLQELEEEAQLLRQMHQKLATQIQRLQVEEHLLRAQAVAYEKRRREEGGKKWGSLFPKEKDPRPSVVPEPMDMETIQTATILSSEAEEEFDAQEVSELLSLVAEEEDSIEFFHDI